MAAAPGSQSEQAAEDNPPPPQQAQPPPMPSSPQARKETPLQARREVRRPAGAEESQDEFYPEVGRRTAGGCGDEVAIDDFCPPTDKETEINLDDGVYSLANARASQRSSSTDLAGMGLS